MASEERSLKRFSGEDDDAGKQLKKWHMWCQAKMVTMKDLKNTQKGPWVYTLLDGKALEACEHVTLEEITKENGEDVIWKILQDRFPEKEASDLMGESLGEVFGLVASEGETAKQWTARVKEVCDRCARRASVDFPKAARGWLALHCAGLSDEQKAIIKAKTQGSLDFDDFRSCFPTYRASGSKLRKAIGAMPVVEEVPQDDGADDHFEDVEALLADHQLHTEVDPSVELSESEAAEALAVTWKERRQEISRVNRSRKFGTNRQLRTDIDELKAKTRCRRCNKVGHWARECKEPKSSGSQSARPSDSGSAVGYVEFVGAAEAYAGHVARKPDSGGLFSAPGCGVLDSGRGRTLIGERTLSKMSEMLRAGGHPAPEIYHSDNTFRFGNGMSETSTRASRICVGIGGKRGTIDAAIIKGDAPLLVGRSTLERLQTAINFKDGTMTILDLPPRKIETNQAGQIVLNLLWRFESEACRAELRQRSHSACKDDPGPEVQKQDHTQR